MESMRDTGPNWLLSGLVVVSVAVHIVIAMQFAAGEKQTAKSYIELEFQAEEEPEARNIPEPVRRERSIMPETAAVTIFAAPAPVVPTSVTPVPELPDSASPQLLAWVPAAEKILAAAGEKPVAVQSKQKEDLPANVVDEYYRKVLARIEAEKKYPYAARKMNAEGRAMVRFFIDSDGTARDVEISESSGNRLLDKSALAAVTDAAPFPEPPKEIFQGPATLEVGVVFKLNGR